MPEKSRSVIRKVLLWLIPGIPALMLATVIYFVIIAVDHPPVVNDYSSLEKEIVSYGENTTVYGTNWLRKSESGLWELYLEGKPFDRGVAFGRLTQDLLYYQETSFVEQIRELVPSDRYLKLLKYFVAFFNRKLDQHIPDEYKHEIYGTSFSCSPEYDFIGSGYQRQLNYHAAHDIGHALQGLNLVGCTSFSVWDGSSSDSSLLVGRNFDFYMGEKFAENKIVCFVNPSEGYKFMMVTWADMIGVVSGMNEKGLTVTLNAAKSSIPGKAATPVTLLAREILQYASTIQEAYGISKKRKLFVSESIMIGSARDGKTAIIEKSPHTYDLVFPETDRIICSNHFQGNTFSDDEINLRNINGSDSYLRYRRVNELLLFNETLDVKRAVNVLRDLRGFGDTDLGLGNQRAINQLIAHHAVVFKPESLEAWVSTSPWQLGKFVAYDLKKVFELAVTDIARNSEIYSGELTIPADTFLVSQAYNNFLKYRRLSNHLRYFTENLLPLPEGFADRYIMSNPALFQTYVNLGEYYREIKDLHKAYEIYQRALTCRLPGLDKETELKKITKKLLKEQNYANTGN
ncbi:MAG TPA: C45 family peptidase [Bacteroidales bacterium]|nr:C45 family peptidase [Bacteroidales bacterium]